MAAGDRPLILPLRVVRARPRLFTCAAIGMAVPGLAGLLTNWRPATTVLAGWDIGVALYLALVAHMMARSDIKRIRQRAADEDEGQLTILVLTVFAALASLAGIFAQLGSAGAAEGGRQLSTVVLPVVTIMLSWVFVHTIFALHYAHEFYDDTGSGGLSFPGNDREPDYWDFVYFSFVVGMTSQVSDVTITSKQIRRTVTAHGIVAFVFNATLLALTVNLAASAI